MLRVDMAVFFCFLSFFRDLCNDAVFKKPT